MSSFTTNIQLVYILAAACFVLQSATLGAQLAVMASRASCRSDSAAVTSATGVPTHPTRIHVPWEQDGH